MAKDNMGSAIAKAVPPPHKLKGYSGGKDEAMPSDDDGDEEAGDASAAVGMMQEFLDLIGSKADAQEACDALDRYLDSRRG